MATKQQRRKHSKLGKKLIKSLKQAVAYMDGSADKSAYRVHHRKGRRQLEDEADLAEMGKRLEEPGENIPWEKVKKELDCVD